MVTAAVMRLGFLAGIMFVLMGIGAAVAVAPFPVLTEPAIQVAHPDQVLLINVGRAGTRLVAVGEHGVIIYSDDNGQSWRQAAVPASISITTVAFATPKIGWAAGDYGIILRTQDGGATWQTQISGSEILQLMTDTANKFLAADPTNADAQRAVHRAQIFESAGPDKPFLSIAVLDAQRVLVFGAYRMTLQTADGGKTWSDWSLHVDDPVSHNYYDSVWSGTSLYVVGEVGSVARSDDQGNSFKLVTAPVDSTLLGIVSPAPNVLLTFGVAGAMYRSADQGQTWTQVKVGTQSNLTAGLTLKSGKVLVISEAGEMFLSSDVGVTFHEVLGNRGMGLFGLTQAANGDVILVGTNGVRVVSAASLD